MQLATPLQAHIDEVLSDLRGSDMAELAALGAWDAGKALVACLGASALAWAMLQNGRAAALTGVCPNPDGSGAPWLVGTNAVNAAPLGFMRASRKAVAAYKGIFPKLVNYVEAGQWQNVRYVQALGFTLGPELRIGRGNFYKFYME